MVGEFRYDCPRSTQGDGPLERYSARRQDCVYINGRRLSFFGEVGRAFTIVVWWVQSTMVEGGKGERGGSGLSPEGGE